LDDNKIETQREIQQQATDLLEAEGESKIHLSFYLTSIYDHSLFEAFSKVIQKLIPQLPTLESLLDILIQNCRMEKAFLIDVMSKIYVATDSSPVDMQTYELCSDMIDVIVDISSIYDNNSKDTEEGSSGSTSGDGEAQATIKLNTGKVLYMREVNKHLALVTLMRQENFEKNSLIIDYNFQCFKEAITDVLGMKSK
jgi:Ras-related GTP-binding protein C/D